MNHSPLERGLKDGHVAIMETTTGKRQQDKDGVTLYKLRDLVSQENRN